MTKLSEEMNRFNERYLIGDEIKWPVEVNGVERRGKMYDKGRSWSKSSVGSMVMVRMCDETKATHLGVYLGDFPVEIIHSYDKQESKLVVSTMLNPAMLVPKLGRIVWGCESFWGPIESEDQLRQITDQEISGIWCIKALKELSERKDG